MPHSPDIRWSSSTAARRRAIDTVERNLALLIGGKLIDRDQAHRARELVRLEPNLKRGIEGSFWVIESINENLAAKQARFEIIDEMTDPSVMLTSNTSGLCVTDIAAKMKLPGRIATTHFWFPGHLVPLVEIVMSQETDPAIAERLKTILLNRGKAPVIVRKDLPGQLANRVLQAAIREASYIVESGLATPEDVDTAIKMGMGIRLPALFNDPGPTRRLKDLVDRGNLGYKTGSGFYDWKVKDMDSLSRTRDQFVMQAVRFFREKESKS